MTTRAPKRRIVRIKNFSGGPDTIVEIELRPVSPRARAGTVEAFLKESAARPIVDAHPRAGLC